MNNHLKEITYLLAEAEEVFPRGHETVVKLAKMKDKLLDQYEETRRVEIAAKADGLEKMIDLYEREKMRQRMAKPA